MKTQKTYMVLITPTPGAVCVSVSTLESSVNVAKLVLNGKHAFIYSTRREAEKAADEWRKIFNAGSEEKR